MIGRRGRKVIWKANRDKRKKPEILLEPKIDSDIARRNIAIIKEALETLHVANDVGLEFEEDEEAMVEVFANLNKEDCDNVGPNC